MNESKNATTTIWVDPDDAPELTDDFFQHADLYDGKTLIRRGRPRTTTPKKSITLRLDEGVISRFKETGKGWQTRMNAALKQYLAEHSPAP